MIFTCFGILKTFRWEYETNKKATDVYIKNNTSVNKNNTIMDEYIYISRSRSFNVEILNVEIIFAASFRTLFRWVNEGK